MRTLRKIVAGARRGKTVDQANEYVEKLKKRESATKRDVY